MHIFSIVIKVLLLLAFSAMVLAEDEVKQRTESSQLSTIIKDAHQRILAKDKYFADADITFEADAKTGLGLLKFSKPAIYKDMLLVKEYLVKLTQKSDKIIAIWPRLKTSKKAILFEASKELGFALEDLRINGFDDNFEYAKLQEREKLVNKIECELFIRNLFQNSFFKVYREKHQGYPEGYEKGRPVVLEVFSKDVTYQESKSKDPIFFKKGETILATYYEIEPRGREASTDEKGEHTEQRFRFTVHSYIFNKEADLICTLPQSVVERKIIVIR